MQSWPDTDRDRVRKRRTRRPLGGWDGVASRHVGRTPSPWSSQDVLLLWCGRCANGRVWLYPQISGTEADLWMVTAPRESGRPDRTAVSTELGSTDTGCRNERAHLQTGSEGSTQLSATSSESGDFDGPTGWQNHPSRLFTQRLEFVLSFGRGSVGAMGISKWPPG